MKSIEMFFEDGRPIRVTSSQSVTHDEIGRFAQVRGWALSLGPQTANEERQEYGWAVLCAFKVDDVVRDTLRSDWGNGKVLQILEPRQGSPSGIRVKFAGHFLDYFWHYRTPLLQLELRGDSSFVNKIRGEPAPIEPTSLVNLASEDSEYRDALANEERAYLAYQEAREARRAIARRRVREELRDLDKDATERVQAVWREHRQARRFK